MNPVLGSVIEEAIARRYVESGADSYGITPEHFKAIVAAVVIRYATRGSEAESLELVRSLRVEELVLARACSAGNEKAWDVFIARFRAALHATACRLTRDEVSGRELADGLHADLYGIPNSEGRRISKLDYYMGRGSLEGWLRTVLARQHIDRCRTHAKDVSLDEQIEHGVSFAQRPEPPAPNADDRLSRAIVQTLAELGSEERFLLASYYLDRRTLADIARQIGVHESTVSRKLDRLAAALRKRIRQRLQSAGVPPRRCDELLLELDVRDIDVDVAASLKQESTVETF
ncbi:MAG: sigma-70 family RNA polymerase sigma factor [Terracidiphilus sp.]